MGVLTHLAHPTPNFKYNISRTTHPCEIDDTIVLEILRTLHEFENVVRMGLALQVSDALLRGLAQFA